jgi:uncharacterized protein with HEPN domain
MSRNPRLYLEEILDSIAQIETYTSGLSQELYQADRLVQDAVLRRIEIIGEAVKHLPDEIKSRHPDVPWRNIVGTRDILIHTYFAVDVPLTWHMIRVSLPELKQRVRAILDEFSD